MHHRRIGDVLYPAPKFLRYRLPGCKHPHCNLKPARPFLNDMTGLATLFEDFPNKMVRLTISHQILLQKCFQKQEPYFPEHNIYVSLL